MSVPWESSSFEFGSFRAPAKSIWTPSDMESTTDFLTGLDEFEQKERGRKVLVPAVIREAVYHRDTGYVAVLVALSDGSRRTLAIHKDSFATFHGRPRKEVDLDEIHKEMERTAELFRRAKGRRIQVEMSEIQAMGDKND